MSDELRALREAVRDLATDDAEVLGDEAWYDRLWELLEPVVDARAERQWNAAAGPPAQLPPHRTIHGIRDRHITVHDAGEYRDPATGEVDVEAHRFSFEGAASLLARHLVDDHRLPRDAVRRWENGLTQGEWALLDSMHRITHTTPAPPKPARRNWGVAWFGRGGESGVCERCQRATRVYQGYNGGAHIGKFCGPCQRPVLSNEA